jgi:hypothetical protein
LASIDNSNLHVFPFLMRGVGTRPTPFFVSRANPSAQSPKRSHRRSGHYHRLGERGLPRRTLDS